MLSLWPRGALQTRSALSRPCLLDLLESRAWVQLAQESRRGRDLRVAQRPGTSLGVRPVCPVKPVSEALSHLSRVSGRSCWVG